MMGCDEGIMSMQDPVYKNGSDNNRYYNNSLFNLTYGAYKFYMGSNKNQVYSNNYIDNPLIRIRSNISSGFQVSFSVLENTIKTYQVMFESQSQDAANANINFTYAGLKNFSIVNSTITINPTSINYSIRNGTKGFLNNVRNATFTVNSNEDWEVVYSSAEGGCDVPMGVNLLNQDTTTCPGTYYVNLTTVTALYTANANAVTLTCQGTIIISNYSGRAFYSSKNNTMVTGCTFYNFTSATLS